MKKSEIIAICNLTAKKRIEVTNIEYNINDYIVYNFSDENKNHKAKIYYNIKGNSYINVNNARYYLNEFIRI